MQPRTRTFNIEFFRTTEGTRRGLPVLLLLHRGKKKYKDNDHSFTTSVRERSRTLTVQQAMSIA
jgi:hypothetical protein